MLLTDSQFSKALQLAFDRRLLPTALGSEAIQEFGRSVIEASVISARVTQASILSEIKKGIEARLTGGRGKDRAQVILALRNAILEAGYTPEKGFPGDEHLGIPPAEPGSLQDLTSWRRLSLIVDTQTDLMRGKAEQMTGLSPVALHMAPAWELVRVYSRRVPRGSEGSSSDSWPTRWVKLGGPEPIHDGTRTRLIAAKTDLIWHKLGHSAHYKDCLNVDYPPFAFRSGMGWKPVTRGECERLGVDLDRAPHVRPAPYPLVSVPPINLGGMDPAIAAKAAAFLAKSKSLAIKQRAQVAKEALRAAA